MKKRPTRTPSKEPKESAQGMAVKLVLVGQLASEAAENGPTETPFFTLLLTDHKLTKHSKTRAVEREAVHRLAPVQQDYRFIDLISTY